MENEMPEGICVDCKHFYDLHFDMSGWHNCCAKHVCYLCANNYGDCDEFELGDVPEGKIKGKWDL